MIALQSPLQRSTTVQQTVMVWLWTVQVMLRMVQPVSTQQLTMLQQLKMLQQSTLLW
jgi:hypothetical protein